MSAVLQAHLPGNYEISDPASDRPGLPICKGCWEAGRTKTTDNLDTVWVTAEGQRMVWWLCSDHAEGLKAEGKAVALLKKVDGVVKAPKI